MAHLVSNASREQAESIMDETADLIEPHILPKLDPDFVSYFVNVISKNNPAQAVPIEEVRAHPEKYRSPCALDTTGYDRVIDHEIDGHDGYRIPIKIYLPDPMRYDNGRHPIHLNFHGKLSDLFFERPLTHLLFKGGGFVLGDLTSESTLCLSMREAGVAVIDVNYRHCPGRYILILRKRRWF